MRLHVVVDSALRNLTPTPHVGGWPRRETQTSSPDVTKRDHEAVHRRTGPTPKEQTETHDPTRLIVQTREALLALPPATRTWGGAHQVVIGQQLDHPLRRLPHPRQRAHTGHTYRQTLRAPIRWQPKRTTQQKRQLNTQHLHVGKAGNDARRRDTHRHHPRASTCIISKQGERSGRRNRWATAPVVRPASAPHPSLQQLCQLLTTGRWCVSASALHCWQPMHEDPA
ncbi:hypothetical protein EDB81DRAFT_155715 [Dactylonectria macrodidyma]|uniref:Uncharacterized protein n=1 Tax=Dactylonectria macrodidyma TaxID=307937 RepID=A0A9P9JKV4_9HYPO|nr:hypothetical protein EDB81DRAFT_155715 [Dactylonectria macrodidyma]